MQSYDSRSCNVRSDVPSASTPSQAFPAATKSSEKITVRSIGPKRSAQVNEITLMERSRFTKPFLGKYYEVVTAQHVLTGEPIDSTGGIQKPDSPKLNRDIRLTLNGKIVDDLQYGAADKRAGRGSKIGSCLKVEGKEIFLDISIRDVLKLCGCVYFDEICKNLRRVEREGGSFEDAMKVLGA